MPASDAERAALMEHLERTIPPMDLRDAEQLLREVKQIFDAFRDFFIDSPR